MYDVFISYAHQDRESARKICRSLEKAGLTVWIDYNNIQPGANWEKSLQEGINESTVMIIIMTPYSESSDAVTRERLYAQSLWKPIFPLLCAGNTWFTTANLQYIDLRHDFDEGLEKLHLALMKSVKREQNEPTAGEIGSVAYSALIDYLRMVYETSDYKLFNGHGVDYPAIIFSPLDVQKLDINSCLSQNYPLSDESADLFAFVDNQHLDELRRAGRQLTDSPTFTFSRIETSPLKLSGVLGTYFDMIRTCDALESEIRSFFTQIPNQSSPDRIRHSLPLRTKLHQQVTPIECLVSGVGRSPMIGGSTLVVFNHNGEYKTLLVQRSASTAIERNFYQPVPSFVFQPRPNMPKRFHKYEWDFQHQVFREYLEELFGLEEQQKNSIPVAHDYFYYHPALITLRSLIAQGKAGLYLTGICMNLLTLRPEICSVLVIFDPTWYERVSKRQVWDKDDLELLRIGWEADSRTAIFLRIESDDLLEEDLPQNFTTHITPQGAVAFWRGIQLARQLISEQKKQA